MDCHTLNDVHGNGRIQETMYAPDAIDAACTDCHDDLVDDAVKPHEIHLDTIDCGACHLETAETCYSCHLESYLEGDHQDRVLTQHDDFIMLINNKERKVHAATYQTIPWKGKTFVGILPIFNHTIMDAEDARDCGDCHNNDAVNEYKEEGRIWGGQVGRGQQIIVVEEGRHTGATRLALQTEVRSGDLYRESQRSGTGLSIGRSGKLDIC